MLWGLPKILNILAHLPVTYRDYQASIWHMKGGHTALLNYKIWCILTNFFVAELETNSRS